MDRDFGQLPGVSSTPGVLRPIARTAELKSVLKVIFHFDECFQWRLLGPDVRIYHCPGDGYVGMSLEHLLAGFRPRCHHFLKTHCKNEF